jgi:hypothetical protein
MGKYNMGFSPQLNNLSEDRFNSIIKRREI